jgi:hypothetical protein
MCQIISLFIEWLIEKFIASSYFSTLDEIHFQHLLTFIVDYILLALSREMARHKSVDNVLNHLVVDWVSRSEELTERVLDVIKNIVYHYRSSSLWR